LSDLMLIIGFVSGRELTQVPKNSIHLAEMHSRGGLQEARHPPLFV
jgi:hypothetical protein